MFSHKSQADLIPSMFVSTAIAMIFTQLAGYGTVLISVGAQVVSSQSIGRGERDKANASFTISVLCVTVLALMLMLLCLVWPSGYSVFAA